MMSFQFLIEKIDTSIVKLVDNTGTNNTGSTGNTGKEVKALKELLVQLNTPTTRWIIK